MPLHKRRLLIVRLCALLVIGAGGLLGTDSLVRTRGAGVSTMEGYVSRYHPGHIDSAEARRLVMSDSRAVILDVRSRESYEDRHVSGAISVPLETLADYAMSHLPDRDGVIVCYCFCGDFGGPALAAVEQLTALGYTRAYYAEPGDEWAFEGALVTPVPANAPDHRIITGDEAMTLYTSGAVLLDVRNQEEYDAGHVDGSVLIPVAELSSRLSELPGKDAVIVVFCKAGGRSATACEILAAAGYANVNDMQRADNWPLPLVTG